MLGNYNIYLKILNHRLKEFKQLNQLKFGHNLRIIHL
jgi:hypothetical protein